MSKDVPADDAKETTLGDVLYADRAGNVSEQQWRELVAGIARGEQPALRALYERSHRVVFTLAMRICGNRTIAEELTVDVFHDVWRRAADYDPANGSVLGWIMNQARSRSIDRLRFEQRKKRVAPDAQTPEDDALVPGPGAAIDARQRRLVLEAALSVLTADERKTIETAFYSEQTYEQTAVTLAQPVGTVKTRVRSALGKLRKELAKGGHDS